MKNSNLKPTLVLVVICFVVTFALAGTYQVTKPVIEAITKANADAARAEVLPSGEGFTPIEGELLEGIADVYNADNNSGVVVTAIERGYGGAMTVMVGIDNDGKVTGVKILQHTETPGLGTKAMTEEHLSQYLDKASVSTGGSGEDNIDAISGATLSSNAVYRAVENSLNQYSEMGGASIE
ncbi:MAG: RnfABCDGE type electron transport complex subunit G [Anaerovoracaceae bacterium]|jgi:electron transport complex protein RnfG